MTDQSNRPVHPSQMTADEYVAFVRQVQEDFTKHHPPAPAPPPSKAPEGVWWGGWRENFYRPMGD